jgi:hypothetical protein
MKRILILLYLSFLGGCAANAVPPDQVARNYATLTAAQNASIKSAVRSALKDPNSAQFGTIIAARNAHGDLLACGLVNAKNSFGGYSGMEPFIGGFNGDVFSVQAIGNLDTTQAVMNVCQQYGLAPI